MRYAIIPWTSIFLNDKIFDIYDHTVNYDNRLEPYLDMKHEFEKNGHEIHTIDRYDDLNTVDYFLFFEISWRWVHRLIKMGKGNRLVYCNAEPPSVNINNCPSGYKKLSSFFSYILTWNDDWIDGKNIFKRNIPYYFPNVESIGIPYEERKLLTFISGNKQSKYPTELYSERRKIVEYFENNYSQYFDFYGSGWNAQEHVCYRGKAQKKLEIFQKYSFAVCFENIYGVKGYITEKIFDCFVAGIVPVYWGAVNVDEYIPKSCFIDYREFSSYAELAEYLISMKEVEYQSYIQNIKAFLASDAIKEFLGSKYAQYIISATSVYKNNLIGIKSRWKLIFWVIKEQKNELLMRMKKYLKSLINRR